MPKIQNVGVGNYIRNPKGRRAQDSRGMNIEVLKVVSNDGNSFLCQPVTSVKAGPSGAEAVLDTTRYLQIPLGTEVEQVTI